MSSLVFGRIPEYAESPIKGVRVWRNPYNKGFVFRLHYSADPNKRTDQWKNDASAGLTKRDWNREYEIDFTSPAGLPVYEDEFEYDFHVAPRSIPAYDAKTLVLGWDFGLTPACAFLLPYRNGFVKMVYEMWSTRSGIERFAEAVSAEIVERFHPNCRVVSFVDPAGFDPNQVDERTCVEAMQGVSHYFQDIRPGGDQSILRRIRILAMWLQKNLKGQPAFQIDPQNQQTIAGLSGGYHYPEVPTGKAVTKMHEKPVKNEFSHIIEAIQYALTGISGILSVYQSLDLGAYRDPYMPPQKHRFQSGWVL